MMGECGMRPSMAADQMLQLELSKGFGNLALQAIVVCKTDIHFQPGFTSDMVTRRKWLPAAAGLYQFRRHFAAVSVEPTESGATVTQDVFIQGRWDYLRLNWNRIRFSWF